jgi:HAD superfamily hydrolase (TIGR01509 family)
MSVAILDIDGTLVDTNYQHAVAWYLAFRQHGFVLPVWKIHRTIGMGGDNLVAHLLSEKADEEQGDDIRSAEKPLYLTMIEQVEPFEGARGFISDLKQRGHTVVLASSAKSDELEHYLDLLDVREVVDGWTSSGDVESSKPAPDLVQAALEKVDGDGPAVMVGDTPWDVEAAGKAGVETVGVLTGGFSEQELREAGAVAVYESIAALRTNLDDTPLA